MNNPVSLRVLLFAGVREAAGSDSVEVPLELPATASQILEQLARQLPKAAPLVNVSRLAVDGSYVSGDSTIERGGVELALIPPVSGG